MSLTGEQKNVALYIGKCVSGFLLLWLAGEYFSIRDISWVVISMLLVLTPDSKEAIPLTLVRIKSNLLASGTTLLFLLLIPQMLVAICLSIIVTILLCHLFDLMAGSRPALAAVIIIALHPSGEHLWSISAERVLAVASGCVVALVLTFLFHRSLQGKDVTASRHSD